MACAPCPCPDPHAGRGIFQKLGDKSNKSCISLQHHCHCVCFGTITHCCELMARGTRAQMMLFSFLILRKQQAFPRSMSHFHPATPGVSESCYLMGLSQVRGWLHSTAVTLGQLSQPSSPERCWLPRAKISCLIRE